jgi:diaminopimelate epimerase
MKEFFKYQSLGNDLVLFDFYKRPLEEAFRGDAWKQFVIHVCDRHYGVGADGVLIVSNNTQGVPEMHIFNADGSQAEVCFNGLRCAVLHLHTYHGFLDDFVIKVGSRLSRCLISKGQITTHVGHFAYEGKREVFVDGKSFKGYVVSVGNPHFVIFESVTLDWLQANGKNIESHPVFPARTNVEFVTECDTVYEVGIYECGCGITLACSSGAAAVVGILKMLQKVSSNQKIVIKMLGGELHAWVNEDGQIILQADAHLAFKGVLALE